MAISEQQAASSYVGRRMSLDEFLALPEQEPALEFADGVVTQKVSPQADHSSTAGNLCHEMNRVAIPAKLGKAFIELRFRAADVAYVPDVAYYRRERLRLRSPKRYAKDQGPPDIAVEVVSPDQSVTGLIRKSVTYINLGVPVAVLADPEDESVLIFRPGQPMLALQGDDRIDLDDILPGFALTVRALFDSIVPDWDDADVEPGAPR